MMLSIKTPEIKCEQTEFEKIGIAAASLLATPVILVATFIFVWGMLELFDLPRPGM